MVRLARLVLMLAILAMGLGLLGTPVAWAATWYPAATSDDGLAAQYFDLESLSLQGGAVQVQSYYENRATTPPEQHTYLTQYRCQQGTFRDLQRDGRPYAQPWSSVSADPLNAGTFRAACAAAGR